MCSGCAGDYESPDREVTCNHPEVQWESQREKFECRVCGEFLDIPEIEQHDASVVIRVY